MFYPQEQAAGFKSRKSLIGKISHIHDSQYRTPVNKIYEPQETEASKFRKSSLKKNRIRTRDSRDLNDRNSQPKRTFSSHTFKKVEQTPLDLQKFRERNFNSGTVSVGRLALSSQKTGLMKTKAPSRSGSTESIRRRSVTMNRQSSNEKAPLQKYCSSEIKEAGRMKGVSINDLLTKKLNIY